MVEDAKKARRKKLRDIKKYDSKMYKALAKSKKQRVPESAYLTQMHDPANLLEIDDLHTFFYTDTGTVKAIDGVSFDIPRGKVVGVVGESGCGKSVTSLSIMRILQEPQGQIAGGQIRYNQLAKGRALDLTKVPLKMMEKLRGGDISMIFQEPMTCLLYTSLLYKVRKHRR